MGGAHPNPHPNPDPNPDLTLNPNPNPNPHPHPHPHPHPNPNPNPCEARAICKASGPPPLHTGLPLVSRGTTAGLLFFIIGCICAYAFPHTSGHSYAPVRLHAYTNYMRVNVCVGHVCNRCSAHARRHLVQEPDGRREQDGRRSPCAPECLTAA